LAVRLALALPPRRAGDSRQAVRGALHKLKIIFAKQK